MTADRLKISADIGGTFTDIALILPDGRLVTRKVQSTPNDYGLGVVEGMRSIVEEHKIDPGAFSQIQHGCTIATNAILEKKGAKTALLTTKGFRDVLELRRIRVPRLYDPLYVKPSPLVARNHRYEVSERMAADGSVLEPLDEDHVRIAAGKIRDAGIESVAVCYLHSYLNGAHERRTLGILEQELPGVFLTVSVDVLPEIKEYERTSTTVVNAYVGPPVARYIERLRHHLISAGFVGQLLVMQSSGGALDADAVTRFPARIVECGPAAGVIGCAREAALSAEPNVITFDMGGTTAKASLIEDGNLTRTDEYEVGGGISLSSRLLTGGGYVLRLPVIDISEVGAGGGSIVRLDKVGAIKVGPESAGAVPGPACYGLGGNSATITDAIVTLGFLNPEALAGGTVPIRADLSREAIQREVAQPTGVSLQEAAWSIYVIAAANMVRAVKAVSTYRGRNPSDFVMMAFGGNGGVFAAELMRHLQMQRAIIPRAAGVLSAVGLCVGDLQFSQSQYYLKRLSRVDVHDLDRQFTRLKAEILDRLLRKNGEGDYAGTRRAALRYVGQAFELSVPVAEGPMTADIIKSMGEAFEAEHQRTYGLRLEGFEIEIAQIEVTLAARGGEMFDVENDADVIAGTREIKGLRPAYFGPGHGVIPTPVVDRRHFGNDPVKGPFIVEEYEGTTIIPPDATGRIDRRGNILIDLADDDPKQGEEVTV